MNISESQRACRFQEYVKTISCVLNPADNGGEAIVLEVDVFDNGDKTNNIYTNMTLHSHCYGTSEASLSLYNVSVAHLGQACKLISEKISALENTDAGEET